MRRIDSTQLAAKAAVPVGDKSLGVRVALDGVALAGDSIIATDGVVLVRVPPAVGARPRFPSADKTLAAQLKRPRRVVAVLDPAALLKVCRLAMEASGDLVSRRPVPGSSSARLILTEVSDGGTDRDPIGFECTVGDRVIDVLVMQCERGAALVELERLRSAGGRRRGRRP